MGLDLVASSVPGSDKQFPRTYVSRVHPGRATPTVVSLLAERIRDVLGDGLVAMYLGGSFSMDDFVDGSSDYDVLVVIRDPLGSREVAALVDLHERLLAEDRAASRLEGDYAPRGWLVPEGTREPVHWFRRGRLQPQPRFMLSADNIANMRQHAIVVTGPAPAEVLPAVHPDQVRAAVRSMLEAVKECSTERQAADEILSLLRSLRALETGAPTTKSDGLRWGHAHLDERWPLILDRVEAIRRGAHVETHDTTLRRAIESLRGLLLPA